MTGMKSDMECICAGPCLRCGREHSLGAGPAVDEARRLMRMLEEHCRIDWTVPEESADPRLRTEPLFGEARGQMFGVMVYRDQDGALGVSKAFSGQFNGVWHVEGWAPPLVDVDAFDALIFHEEREIKRMGRRIEALPKSDPVRSELVRMRKDLSRELMREIHALYSLSNFRGVSASLAEAFHGNGIPTGTGDCCAPKLLNLAARSGWTPLGLAEFFWGRANRSGSKQHGQFYSACAEKCRPILGFMLCGLNDS